MIPARRRWNWRGLPEEMSWKIPTRWNWHGLPEELGWQNTYPLKLTRPTRWNWRGLPEELGWQNTYQLQLIRPTRGTELKKKNPKNLYIYKKNCLKNKIKTRWTELTKYLPVETGEVYTTRGTALKNTYLLKLIRPTRGTELKYIYKNYKNKTKKLPVQTDETSVTTTDSPTVQYRVSMMSPPPSRLPPPLPPTPHPCGNIGDSR